MSLDGKMLPPFPSSSHDSGNWLGWRNADDYATTKSGKKAGFRYVEIWGTLIERDVHYRRN
jgi:hypothetical protein